MCSSERVFLSIAIYIALLPFSLGGWIPSRRTESIWRQDSVPTESNLPDFGPLVKQASGSGTVSSDELRKILLMLRLTELQTVALIDELLLQDGLHPASSTEIVAPTILSNTASSILTEIPLASLSSAVDSALVGLSTLATDWSNITSTTTVRVTSTTMAAPVTVTATLTSSLKSVATPSTTTTQSSHITENTIPEAASSNTTSIPASSNAGLTELAPTASTVSGNIFQESLTTNPPTSTPSIQPILPAAAAIYQFDATSSRNVAVYFGQTSVTGQTTLEAQCADPNIDIVILAFVISQLDGGAYPQINFGAACGGQTAQQAAEAPGLLSCPDLAGNITSCQRGYGKKVLLSIGGATSQFDFSSAEQASTFGEVMWHLFGPPGNVNVNLRPFGTVEVDGFDVDNEDNLPAHFDTLATTLRSHFSSATKTYYLSSAPQCPFPDASDPLPLLLLCDFVWVQFYNNSPCQIGSSGFTASVQQWSTALEASTLATKPRLYLGAPAFGEAGPSAYASLGGPEGIGDVVKQVQGLGLGNFGGVMFWDGPEGMLSTEGGKDIMAWAKEALES